MQDYPTTETPAGPLYYEGDDILLTSTLQKRVAVVGTRQPTLRIREITKEIVQYLAKHDIVIVSGLAIGVDTIAHTTAIASDGLTAAILGSPLTNIYPSCNKALVGDILASGGCTASQFPSHKSIEKSMFPARNKTIAALSDAIVITGIAPVSGTFHVVWEAKRRGIPVFAVPTDPKDLLCGTNLLIKKGDAILLQDWGQIIDAIED